MRASIVDASDTNTRLLQFNGGRKITLCGCSIRTACSVQLWGLTLPARWTNVSLVWSSDCKAAVSGHKETWVTTYLQLCRLGSWGQAGLAGFGEAGVGARSVHAHTLDSPASFVISAFYSGGPKNGIYSKYHDGFVYCLAHS
jgi:hypothetical protein